MGKPSQPCLQSEGLTQCEACRATRETPCRPKEVNARLMCVRLLDAGCAISPACRGKCSSMDNKVILNNSEHSQATVKQPFQTC